MEENKTDFLSEVTIREAISRGEDAIKENGGESPLLDARVILGHVLGVDSLYLHVHDDELLTNAQADEYNSKISERLNHRPVAYIVGEKEFYGRSFVVNEDVLIPRPDTEIAVECAIDAAKEFGSGVKILDLCCGSGAIGLTLAKEIEGSMVLLSDISPKALKVAEENKQRLGAENAAIMQSDLFDELEGAVLDIIVSNPPYVTQEEIGALSYDISQWEPHIALFGGSDGLSFYREIIPSARGHFKNKGVLILEIGAYQAGDVAEIMKKCGYEDVEVLTDLSGCDRVVKGIFRREDK